MLAGNYKFQSKFTYTLIAISLSIYLLISLRIEIFLPFNKTINIKQRFQALQKRDDSIFFHNDDKDFDEDDDEVVTSRTHFKIETESASHLSADCIAEIGRPNQFKTIFLLSLPGSGNTWTRFLLERATGYVTSSWFPDSSLEHGGFIGESLSSTSGRSLVIKNHGIGPGITRTFNNKKTNHTISACLYIVRDPKKAMLSEFTRLTNDPPTLNKYGIYDSTILKKNAHTAALNPDNFKKLEGLWNKTKTTMTDSLNMYENYYQPHCKQKMHFIQYEKLKESPEVLEMEIKKAVNFINSVNDQFNEEDHLALKIDCLEQDLEGYFHRPKKKNVDDLKNGQKNEVDLNKLFTKSEKRVYNRNLEKFNQFLENQTEVEFRVPQGYYF